MKTISKYIIIALLIVPLLFISGCSSTRLISSWKAPDGEVKQHNKILVLGLMHAKYREIRENIEEAVVHDLNMLNISSGAAYTEYGPKAFEKLTEEEALGKIHDNGYDAVLVVALLDRTKDKNYSPGNVTYRPYTYYNYFWGYYQTVFGRIYQPGYYSETTSYILEANLYDLSSKKLEYSAQTKSFDPSSARTLGIELAKTILSDMKTKGVLISSSPQP